MISHKDRFQHVVDAHFQRYGLDVPSWVIDTQEKSFSINMLMFVDGRGWRKDSISFTPAKHIRDIDPDELAVMLEEHPFTKDLKLKKL